jgi:hypothetical protein
VRLLLASVLAVFELQDTRLERERLSDAKLGALTDLLRNFLAEGGEFKVVPESGLRRAMLEQKKESLKECFDEACQIEIGKAVSASKLVTTKIIQVGEKCIITSTLFDLRSETTDRAEHAKGDCSEEALAATLEKVAVKLKADRAHAELETEEKRGPETWDPGKKKKVIVSFRSEPPGALVLIDGKLLCRDSSTGCRRTLRAGKRTVSMQKERYLERTEEVFVEDGAELVWELEPNFASLAIRTEPPDLEVRIDGQIAGRTPLEPEVEPGDHLIELADACYFPSERRITALVGRSESVQLDSVPREGAIEVSAVDASGNAVRGDVYVDGKLAGRAPDLIKVNVCAKTVRVASEEHGVWEAPLSIGERETLEIEAKLSKDGTPPAAEAPRPGMGLRLGGQAMLGILCLEGQQIGGSTQCVDRLVGYGGALQLQWPTNLTPAEGGFYFRGGLRVGFLYYPADGAKPSVFELPGAIAGEVGFTGEGYEYGFGGEAAYAFRKAQGDPTAPHAFDLGGYLALRFFGFEVGGGVYYPLTGVGDSILARMWLGFGYDL